MEFDFSELDDFIDDLENMDMNKVLKKSVLEVEKRMEEPLMLLTPVDTGHMRESWEKLPLEQGGDEVSGGWANYAESSDGFPYPVVIDQGSKKFVGLHITDRTKDAVEPEIPEIIMKHVKKELK